MGQSQGQQDPRLHGGRVLVRGRHYQLYGCVEKVPRFRLRPRRHCSPHRDDLDVSSRTQTSNLGSFAFTYNFMLIGASPPGWL